MCLRKDTDVWSVIGWQSPSLGFLMLGICLTSILTPALWILLWLISSLSFAVLQTADRIGIGRSFVEGSILALNLDDCMWNSALTGCAAKSRLEGAPELWLDR